METKTFVDKSDWGHGPWMAEPDKANWIDEESGLDCMIVRGPTGALCGYVGVPAEHPHYEDDDYFNIPVNVHGGVSFLDHCAEGEDKEEGICHPEESAANRDVWWVGFDCAHAYDKMPGRENAFYLDDAIYRTFDYVKDEVTHLARQLKEML